MTDDRRKQIEEKANGLAERMIRSMCSREELYSACILMAEWADANPDKIDWTKATATSDMGAFNFVVRLQDQIKQLQSDRKILVEAIKFMVSTLKAIGEGE